MGFIELLLELAGQYSTVLTIIIAVATVSGLFWKKVLRPILIILRDLSEQIKALRELSEAQLTVNGGGSLLDKVNQIAPNHRIAEAHWAELHAADEKIAEDLAAARDTLAADVRLARQELEKQLHEIKEKPSQAAVVVNNNSSQPTTSGE